VADTPGRQRSQRAALGVALLVAWLGAATRAEPDETPGSPTSAPAATPAPAAATYVGEAVCSGCHAKETEHWNGTVHADVFHRALAGEPGARVCEECHGPGSEHVASGGDRAKIVAFTHDSRAPVEQQNGMCLACHTTGGRIHWRGSMHETQELSCSDCHNPMSRTSATGLLRKSTVNETCFTCHAEQRLEFRKHSHMPLLEGKLSCVDCHQPHGSITRPLLKADTVNLLCTSCHAEKRGPFLWEHAPVTESCLNCHLPHGSNRDSLLNASIPFLCQQCHAQIGLVNHPTALQTRANLAAGPRPDERIVNRGCVNCHAQIHGSNHPSGARFHR
jgi:DmsE family decaheme c-type cytochrome